MPSHQLNGYNKNNVINFTEKLDKKLTDFNMGKVISGMQEFKIVSPSGIVIIQPDLF